MGSQVTLVKGNRQVGFQVDQATHILWFRLKEVARWDLRLTEKKKRKKKTEKERKKKKNQKKKKVRFLDEWIIQQVKKFSLQSLLCKTLRSFAS